MFEITDLPNLSEQTTHRTTVSGFSTEGARKMLESTVESNDEMQRPNQPISSAALQEREARHILSLIQRKPIIAIDLDYTVNSRHCF